MTQHEQQRLKHIADHLKAGNKWFDRLELFYKEESLLDSADIFARTKDTIRLNYTGNMYLLKIACHLQEEYGQIEVYRPIEGTEFSPHPKFIHKANSLLLFDLEGNIFPGRIHTHAEEENCVEEIIKEVIKPVAASVVVKSEMLQRV